MKKICVLMAVVLSLVSCTTVDYVHLVEYIYVNNSGVEVAIVGKNKSDRYRDVPDSLVILNGASFSIPSSAEGPDPYGPSIGHANAFTVKVYFNKKTLVVHDDGSRDYGIRDMRGTSSYSYIRTGERSQDVIYTFTPEDYQLALELQE